MPAKFSYWSGLALFSFSLLLPVAAQQDASASSTNHTAYISNKLVTYLYEGPGRDYKIIASVNAGDEISISAENGSYLQVSDSKGRSGWILKQYISATPVFDVNTEQLTEQLTSLQSQIDSLDTEKQQLKQQLEETTAALQQAEASTISNQQTIALLTSQLQEKPSSFWQDKMVLGGFLAIAGLILGLLIPGLIPQRRRNDRWM